MPPGYKVPMLRPYLLKPKVLDLDDTVEISWDLQADTHSPEMVSKTLADVEGNGIRSFSPLVSNLLPREVRALDEALSKAGPESSLVSLIKRLWDIRLGKMKIQQVPGLQFIVKDMEISRDISPKLLANTNPPSTPPQRFQSSEPFNHISKHLQQCCSSTCSSKSCKRCK